MLSEQNFKQRQLLLSLQDAWADFKEHVIQRGVELDGYTLEAIKRIESGIRKISTGPESWAKGRQDNSVEPTNLTLR